MCLHMHRHCRSIYCSLYILFAIYIVRYICACTCTDTVEVYIVRYIYCSLYILFAIYVLAHAQTL